VDRALHANLLRENAGNCPPRGVGNRRPAAIGGLIASARRRRRVMRLTKS
jgi:hypothetical protein